MISSVKNRNNLNKKEMYKSKYANLMQHLMNEHDLILLDSEQQEIEKWLDKDLEAINYRCCSELLPTEEEWFEIRNKLAEEHIERLSKQTNYFILRAGIEKGMDAIINRFKAIV